VQLQKEKHGWFKGEPRRKTIILINKNVRIGTLGWESLF